MSQKLNARVQRILLNVLGKGDVMENPFGFSFGRSKRAAGAKRYYVAFTDVDDNTRDFYVNAHNKTDAKTKAKAYLREDDENLTGAQWHIEQED
jgi:uncharacterized lipoprotein